MSAILSLITTPIGEAAPFGASINHESVWDTLKNAIGKSGNFDLNVSEIFLRFSLPGDLFYMLSTSSIINGNEAAV